MINKLYKSIIFPLLLASTATYAMPVVYFDFDSDGLEDTSTSVLAGQTFTADIYISGVDNTHGGLISWGTQLDFDSIVLNANSFTIAPAWPLHGTGNQIDNTIGVVELLASSFTSLQGTARLFSISFTAEAAGLSALSLQQLFASNTSFTGFAAADGYDYDAEIQFNAANVSVSAVPVPASVFLFASGLIALLGRLHISRHSRV